MLGLGLDLVRVRVRVRVRPGCSRRSHRAFTSFGVKKLRASVDSTASTCGTGAGHEKRAPAAQVGFRAGLGYG